MSMFIIVLSVVLAIVAIGLLYVFNNGGKNRLEKKYAPALKQIQWAGSDYAQYQSVIDDYYQIKESSEEIEENSDAYQVPVFYSPSDSEDSEQVLSRVAKFIDKNSPAFAGTEQAILSLIPPEKVGVVILKASEVITEHIGEAKLEMAQQLKEMAATASQEVYTNNLSDLAVECIKNYYSGLVEYAEKIIHFDQPISVFFLVSNEFKGLLFNFHAVSRGLDPIFHLNDTFLPQIKNIASEHSKEIFSTVGGDISAEFTEIDPSGHFPFVTVLVSGFREVKLLDKGKTEVEDAIKNISLDLAGSGLGGFAGAKGGALIGSAILPGIGTAVGGLLGGVIGAVAGRSVSNGIKYEDYEDAKASYERLCSEWSTVHSSTVKQMGENINDHSSKCAGNYQEEQPEFPAFDKVDRNVIRICETLIEKINEDLEMIEQKLTPILRTESKASERLNSEIERIDQKTSEIRKRLPNDVAIFHSPIDALQRILVIPTLKDSQFQSSKLQCVNELDESIKVYCASSLTWSYQKVSAFKKAMYSITDNIQKESDAYLSLVEDWKSRIRYRENNLKTEAGKVGR